MLTRLIGWSVAHRVPVLLATIAVALAGLSALTRTTVDAVPDLSDIQVIIMTEWPGQGPQLVEDQVTYPLEAEMLRAPRTKLVRGMSQFGLSAVYVVFEDGTDLYWARSRVLEYLGSVRDKLPPGASLSLGPDATGVGWVMQYVLTDTTGRRDLAELRSLEDWTVRPALTSVPGVAEIAALGGFEREYQVDVDPDKLLAYRVPLGRVVDAVRRSNEDAGGRVLEMGGAEYVVRGRGRFASLDDIRLVPIGMGSGGKPITVGDVADVHLGPAIRRGLADLDGRGEVVTGWVVMRSGENPRAVIDRVKAKMAALQSGFPTGVVFVDGYDRSGLIDRAIATLRGDLLEESVIVAAVTVLFLLHASSALVAIVTLPLGVLMVLLAMRLIGLSANIMSLGGIAIAIGGMIDAAIVLVENFHKHVERNSRHGAPRAHWALVVESAQEVGPSLFIALLIVTVSFVPVFALQDQEGRLFRPLAWTKTLSMASAALLSVTLIPVAMGLCIRRGVRPERANPVNRLLIRVYRPVLESVLEHRRAVVLGAAVVVALTVIPWLRLGSEFMPPLNEGSVMDMPSVRPGIGTGEAKAILEQRDAALARIPEVAVVLGKAGRAETATDMAPMAMIETIAVLKERSAWRPGVTYDSILRQANATVRTPGVANMWSMPIRNRLDMLATGIKTPVGIKLYGPNLDTLDRVGQTIEALLPAVRGTNSVYAERAAEGRYLTITVDRVAADRYGMTAGDVLAAASAAIGGMDAGMVVVGRERYGVLVRYPRALRDSPEAIRSVLVATPSGAEVALGAVARVDLTEGPTLIKSEGGSLQSIVYVDVSGRDIGGYVTDAQRVLARQLHLPTGYRLEWSGQFEAMQRAGRTLRLVVPGALALIFLLLYANFRSVAESAIVMLALPFALVGGVWCLWLLEYNVSVAVAVGFIALAGVAAETGIVMLLYLDHAHARHPVTSRADLDAAITEGAVERIRPKIMTVTSIMAGLVPILWSQGTGADVMKRIAAPMVGGMVSSTVLTLVVIPAAYSLWRERAIGHHRESRPARSAADVR